MTPRSTPIFLTCLLDHPFMGSIHQVAGWAQRVRTSPVASSSHYRLWGRTRVYLCRHLEPPANRRPIKRNHNGKSEGGQVHQVRWKTATGDLVFDALNGDGPSRLAKEPHVVPTAAQTINCRVWNMWNLRRSN
jgi:hypothetical protein